MEDEERAFIEYFKDIGPKVHFWRTWGVGIYNKGCIILYAI